MVDNEDTLFQLYYTPINYQEENWRNNPWEFTPSAYDRIDNPNNLYEAFKKSKRGVMWKTSVQRYEINLLSKIKDTYYTIESGKYNPSKYYEFTLSERGHNRSIKAVTIEDRVVQRSLNDNVLLPAISNKLIYDNGASQINKGISFARSRFEKHLYSAYREYGYGNGYILLMDYSKYFDNILHSIMLNFLRPFVNDAEYSIIVKIFNQFKVDVSYMTDEEYENCLDNLFCALDHDLLDKTLFAGTKFMEKSVGIGNQLSQIAGIYYPHAIDNYFTCVRGISYYARYMDDSYIIARTKEELKELLQCAENQCRALGIFINHKKTKIVPLSSEITYLKIKYRLTETGKIIKLVPRSTIKRELRRIEKFKVLFDEGRMSLLDILQCYLSWYGTYSIYDCKKEIQDVDLTFRITFGLPVNINLHELLRQMTREERAIARDLSILYGP